MYVDHYDTLNSNCNHNQPAQRLEVRKEGKNQGREFYECRLSPGHPHDPEARCNFFKWAAEEAATTKIGRSVTTDLTKKGEKGG
jgi:hypothetical protein